MTCFLELSLGILIFLSSGKEQLQGSDHRLLEPLVLQLFT